VELSLDKGLSCGNLLVLPEVGQLAWIPLTRGHGRDRADSFSANVTSVDIYAVLSASKHHAS